MTALFSPRSEVATASLPDGAALLDLKVGKYFALNRVGAVVWSSLQKNPASLEDLTIHVASAFKIEPEVCRQDVKMFLSTMVKAGLVETRPESV